MSRFFSLFKTSAKEKDNPNSGAAGKVNGRGPQARRNVTRTEYNNNGSSSQSGSSGSSSFGSGSGSSASNSDSSRTNRSSTSSRKSQSYRRRHDGVQFRTPLDPWTAYYAAYYQYYNSYYTAQLISQGAISMNFPNGGGCNACPASGCCGKSKGGNNGKNTHTGGGRDTSCEDTTCAPGCCTSYPATMTNCAGACLPPCGPGPFC